MGRARCVRGVCQRNNGNRCPSLRGNSRCGSRRCPRESGVRQSEAQAGNVALVEPRSCGASPHRGNPHKVYGGSAMQACVSPVSDGMISGGGGFGQLLRWKLASRPEA